MARLAFCDTHMVELKSGPTVSRVAVLTVALEVVGVDAVERQLMTTVAIPWGIGVLTALVAFGALDFLVLPGEWIDAVVQRLPQEGDGYRCGYRGLFRYEGYELFWSAGFL